MDYRVRYKSHYTALAGFTLIELLIVISLFSLFTYTSITFFSTFRGKNNMSVAVMDVVAAFRHAQANAEAVNGDSSWGTKTFSDRVVVFKGASYASRVTSADQILTLPSGMTLSGLSEVVFSKVTGSPSASGTTTVTSANGTKNIYVNGKGLVTY